MKIKKEGYMKAVFTLLFAQIFIKIIGLVYKLYLTNKDGFGDIGIAVYSSGFQIYALLLTFSSTGVPNAISKLVSEKIAIGDENGAYKIFKIAFIMFALLGTLGSLFLFCSANVIAENWLLIPEATLSLIALAPSIFFVSIGSVLRGYFNGIQKFSITAKSQSIEQIFKTIFTILLVELLIFIEKNNIIIMAAGANLATTLATLCSFIYIYMCYKTKKVDINNKVTNNKNYINMRIKNVVKKIIIVAFPISLSSLISSFNKNIDSFTIVRYLKYNISENDAKAQYGILSGKIDSICALAFSLNIAFVTTLVPNISKLKALGMDEEIRKKSKLFILISILIGVPISFIMYSFANEILELLFPNASEGSIYLKYSSFSIVFMLLAQTLSAILQGIGKNNVSPIAFGIGMFAKLLCNVFLISNKAIGIFGAIFGNFICNFIAFSICLVVLIKSIKLRIKIVCFIIKPLIASFVMIFLSKFIYKILICIINQNLSILLSISIAILFYIFTIIILFKREKIELY